jgi:NTP pyrophosphatase (non-canonical NTP hydrolase)
MTLNEYQQSSAATDASEISKNSDLSVLLLGLAGETGSLLTLYKKWLRDGDAYQIVEARLSEEMGDILWYLAAIARRRGLSLEAIASANLVKTSGRWLKEDDEPLFDEGRDALECLPRTFVAELRDGQDEEGRSVMRMSLNDEPLGAELTDNAHDPDGYRFHDILHLSLAANLGWSPVIRALLKKKRKSDAKLDEIEDGGRAIAIEEGIAALIFTYAAQHSMLDGVTTIDWGTLRTCTAMTAGLEVRSKPLFAWERAILSAFAAWRDAIRNGGVRLRGDLVRHRLDFEPLNEARP